MKVKPRHLTFALLTLGTGLSCPPILDCPMPGVIIGGLVALFVGFAFGALDNGMSRTSDDLALLMKFGAAMALGTILTGWLYQPGGTMLILAGVNFFGPGLGHLIWRLKPMKATDDARQIIRAH